MVRDEYGYLQPHAAIKCQRTDHNGFWPRIDIGDVTLPGFGYQPKVGIAYTGRQYEMADVFVTYWPAGQEVE